MEELQKARELAWSFSGLEPPQGSVYIGKEQRGGETYYYYRTEDEETPYLYETEGGYAFKKKMHDAEKKYRNGGNQSGTESLLNSI